MLANDLNADGGPISIFSVTQPANGTVAITGGGTALSYVPDAGFCGGTADAFTYTLNGGDSATVSVTVECFEPSISTSLSATPTAPAIGQAFRYDATVDNTGNVPLDGITMIFTVPVQMAIVSVTTGTYTGFSGFAAGEGVRVSYEKNTALGVFTLWGSSPNTTTNTTLTHPPPGSGGRRVRHPRALGVRSGGCWRLGRHDPQGQRADHHPRPPGQSRHDRHVHPGAGPGQRRLHRRRTNVSDFASYNFNPSAVGSALMRTRR